MSRTRLRELVRDFRTGEVAALLDAKPDLLRIRDERGRNWLHLACMRTLADGRTAADSIRMADLLLAHGLGLNDPAFTEGAWQATPLWHAVAHGQNMALAEHLLKLGSTPDYCLFAAVWNEDRPAIRLLIAHGAKVDDDSTPGETPFLGAIAWSKFGPAEELLEAGADPDTRNGKGQTALHLMLKKGSDARHFEILVRHKARGDIPDAEGRTAIDILRRKRDPAFHAIAEGLATS